MKILVRLGADLTIKSDRVRAKFTGRMIGNMKQAFRDHGITATVDRKWSRLYVYSEDKRAPLLLTKIFGIASLSVIECECKATLEEIIKHGEPLFKDIVKDKIFAVKARRVGHHPYTSADLGRELGAKLFPYAKGVDLNKPEVPVYVEVRNDSAHLFSKVLPGATGLPLGVGGRILCLISGGFDSAVAAWMMQKRGVEVDYLFCNLAGGAYERSVQKIVKYLHSEWSHGSSSKLHVVDFQPLAEHIKKVVRPSHAQVILKRMLYRAANLVATSIGSEAIVTGEVIGQVSSQTLRNLCTIEEASALPILRPLIGLDKDEIIRLARRIGTFDLSAVVEEYCQLVPDKPVTACPLPSALHEEVGIDFAILTDAVSKRSVTEAKDLSLDCVDHDLLSVDQIDPQAILIDLRDAESFKAWHVDGSINLELHELLARFKKLDKSKTYILLCPIGLQSLVGAEKMQAQGFQAYALRGGLRLLSPRKTEAQL